jgi:hypothetical protein
MNNSDDERLIRLLNSVIVPVTDTELKHDLWPQLLYRLQRESLAMPWFDWALATVVPVWLLCFPSAISGLLYHL